MRVFRFIFLFFLLGNAQGASQSQNYYRTFLNPVYQGSRLAYCMEGDKTCGLPVANRYCQQMGYEHATQQIIDYNVGKTQAFLCRKPCKGWQCNGFSLIRCVGQIIHKPISAYYYRSQAFVCPRFNHARVDWCYENGKGCGKRASNSFCRRMGYLRAKSYKIQNHVLQTKAIGNHRLCLGEQCKAFGEIICYR